MNHSDVRHTSQLKRAIEFLPSTVTSTISLPYLQLYSPYSTTASATVPARVWSGRVHIYAPFHSHPSMHLTGSESLETPLVLGTVARPARDRLSV